MEVTKIICFTLISYMIGSMTSSIWIARKFFGIEIKEHGSGNAGATNTFRVLGKQAGITVLFLDVIKGLLVTGFVFFLNHITPGSERWVNLKLLFGMSAVIGHIFPLYENFEGGKGIATLLGMVIGIHLGLAIACVCLFLLVLILTKYVSLSSILATISFPIFSIWVFKKDEPLLLAFGIVASVLVILTHQKNIKKIIKGEESKAKIFSTKS